MCIELENLITLIKKFYDKESCDRLSHVVKLVSEYIENNKDNITLDACCISKERKILQINAILQKQAIRLDTEKHGWQVGISIRCCNNKVQVSPIYRSNNCNFVCVHLSQQRYFSKNTYRQSSFNKLIERVLSVDHSSIITRGVKYLHDNTVSLREFYIVKNIVLKYSNDEFKQFFDDSYLQQVYFPHVIANKNKRWLSTANTNINAREFFNKILYIINQGVVSEQECFELECLSSEIFLNGPDLINCAPKVFN